MPYTPPRPLRLRGAALPAVGGLRVYVCGITPYDVTHLGHAATYLWVDAAVRVVRAQGTAVQVARNVTDIDDGLLREARRRDTSPDLLGALQRAAFDASMARLRVRAPDLQPTAVQSVRQVLQLAQGLLDAGAGYLRDGTVYGRTGRAWAAADLDEGTARALATEYDDHPDDPAKDDPFDVAVWRAAATGEPSWPSPWGPGRPGWHAECAAMVLATYGASVDLHAGGADLRFPHHAAEAALAEAVTGVRPFARAWLHAGVVGLGGAKMAKSTGNLVMVDDLLARHSVAAVRLLCLHRPWALDWDFDPGLLVAAEDTLERLYRAGGRPGGEPAVRAVDEALLDNLDVPRAVEVALEAGGPATRRLLDVLQLG